MRLKSSSERGVLEQIRRSANAPDGAFGAVDKSGLILADAAQGAASVLLAASERRQDERDKAKVNEAVSSFIKKDSTLRFDPESGLMFKSGGDAHGLYERAGNDYVKIHEEITKGLENERQKKMYREAVTPHEQSAGIALSKHEAEATRKWNLEQADDLIKTSAGALAASWRSPEGKAAAASAARQAVITVYGAESPEQQAVHIKDMMAVQAAHGLDIVISSEPGAAEEYINAFRSSFDDVAFNALKDKAVKAALPVKAQKLYTEVGGDFNKGIAYIEKNISAGEQKAYRAEFENYYADMQKVKNERYKQASSEIAKIYLSGGSLSGGELQKLTDAGIISPEIAITWSNAFDNRVEKQLNIIYRNEVRAERAEQKRFRERLKKAPPTEKAFLLLEYNYGVTKADAQKNYERDRKKMEMQNLSESDILDAVGLGEYTEPQGRLLLSGLKKQDTLYNKAASRERQTITDIFKSIPAISESDKNAALMSFDEQAFRENVKKEELPFLRNSVVSEILGKKDYASARLNPFDSDAEKMLEKIKEQGTLESKRKKNNKSSIDDILGSLGDNP